MLSELTLDVLAVGTGFLVALQAGLAIWVSVSLAPPFPEVRPRRWRRRPAARIAELALLLLPLLLAGCSGYHVVEEWSAGGCATASTETDQVRVCGTGLDQRYEWDDPESRPNFTCKAEWKHLGKVEFTTAEVCRAEQSPLRRVMPTFAGRLEWTINDDGGGFLGIRCSLKLTRFDNTTLAINTNCASARSD